MYNRVAEEIQNQRCCPLLSSIISRSQRWLDTSPEKKRMMYMHDEQLFPEFTWWFPFTVVSIFSFQASSSLLSPFSSWPEMDFSCRCNCRQLSNNHKINPLHTVYKIFQGWSMLRPSWSWVNPIRCQHHHHESSLFPMHKYKRGKTKRDKNQTYWTAHLCISQPFRIKFISQIDHPENDMDHKTD